MSRIYMGLKRRYFRFIEKISMEQSKLYLNLNNVRFGKNLKVRGKLKIYNGGEITIGDDCTINSAYWANPIGYSEHTQFQVLKGGMIEIGDGCGFSNCAITSAKMVRIGNNVLIGADVKIYDTDFHPTAAHYRYGNGKDQSKTASSKIEIMDGVFIGSGSIILKGAVIGINSVIGANSVVTGTIPDNEVWAGNPARFIKSL